MVGISSLALIATFTFGKNKQPLQASNPGAGLVTNNAFELVSITVVLDGIARANSITLTAYSLRPNAVVVRDLEAASDRGAHVSVALSRGFGMYVRQNATTAAELGSHNVRVHVLESTSQSTHIKAVILDGDLYLSDRNWAKDTGEEVVIRDRVLGDRTLIERAVLGESGGNDHLWTKKSDALAAEGDMLSKSRSHRLQVESESFSASSPIFAELKARGSAGDDVKLIVAESEYSQSLSERAEIKSLLTSGVQVRLSNSDEKFAVAGDSVWIGSANATGGAPDQIDFGLVLSDETIAGELSAQFDRAWQRAKASSPE